MTRIGSLCSGYGGLELGLMAVVGGSVAWHVEYDKHPSAVLEARFPGVPNYGDITKTDWTQVEPVDWLTAGYPCQPFSHAGKRKGSADERHLWPFVADAIGALHPRRVLLENVAGHVSLGLDAVLWDLAALGYDAQWGVVRAADAGAPHNRARIFIVASDTRSERHGGGQDGRSVGRVDGQNAGEARQRERPRPVAGDRGAAAPADADQERCERCGGTRGRRGRSTDDREPAADTTGEGPQGCWPQRSGEAEAFAPDRRPVPDAGRRGWRQEDPRGCHLVGQGGLQARRDEGAGTSGPDRHAPVEWGDYEPAIRRWEVVTGRVAPAPTERGPSGERLNPRFVEWMMGLSAGHVTDVLPRNPALKALGNGVVPQQATLALRALLGVEAVAA